MKYAMLFPGQGSQAVGMLGAYDSVVVRETLSEAGQQLGWDLGDLVRNGPAEELNRTERTQPALLAASVALWRHWLSLDAPPPAALAGHSLGEYSALVAAGALDFGDALRLVELRGQLMQEAVPQGTGGMTAVIGLDDDKIEALCKSGPAGVVLEPVNFNAPGQVVVAGEIAGLEWLEANGKAQGARMLKRLPMSVPSHCSMMRDAARRLGERLAGTAIHTPAIPVLHNLDAQPRRDAGAIREALVAQLHRPVQWTRTVQSLHADGVQAYLECGPGKVLVGLNKRILDEAKSLPLEDPASLTDALNLARG
jgi:[acyl-carrier-protein] S-malonyltransferase